MARILRVLRDPNGPCAYLPDEQASLDHRIALDVSPEEFDTWLERGWRRFGPDYFRPACEPCRACVPTRIDVAAFQPTESQKRVWKRGRRFDVAYGPPAEGPERLALFHKWHENRADQRGWVHHELEPEHYRMQFAYPHPAARELTFYDDGRLVGVSLCDETPRALSAAYFYYDPDYARFSLGTLNVLSLLALAAEREKAWLYLGFWVERCPSLHYKAKFGAAEHLHGRPSNDESPRWAAEIP